MSEARKAIAEHYKESKAGNMELIVAVAVAIVGILQIIAVAI
jgi:hypothetical protein